MAMEFRLLGGVEVRDGERLIDIGHARQRCVLAGLLADANRVVACGELVDRVWGAQPLPGSPLKALQTYISLLRRSVAADGQVTIVRRWAGTSWLSTRRESICTVFAGWLTRLARSATRKRPPYSKPRSPYGTVSRSRAWIRRGSKRCAARWPDERLAVQLDLIDIQLRRGLHDAMAVELATSSPGNPFDERLAGQYMVALYGCGRQGDALACYQGIRRRLADELGCDPGTALQRLHQQILTADPALPVAALTPAGARGCRWPWPSWPPGPSSTPAWSCARSRRSCAISSARWPAKPRTAGYGRCSRGRIARSVPARRVCSGC